MSMIKEKLLNGRIVLPEVSRRPARLQGFRTLEGSFRLTVEVGAAAHHVDLTPEQTIHMATGMLRAMGIEVDFTEVPNG